MHATTFCCRLLHVCLLACFTFIVPGPSSAVGAARCSGNPNAPSGSRKHQCAIGSMGTNTRVLANCSSDPCSGCARYAALRRTDLGPKTQVCPPSPRPFPPPLRHIRAALTVGTQDIRTPSPSFLNHTNYTTCYHPSLSPFLVTLLLILYLLFFPKSRTPPSPFLDQIN